MGKMIDGISRPSRGVSFSLLSVFCRVAESGSFSAASRSLGISVSSVSRDIQALEDALAVRLFERSSRSVSLTEAGQFSLKWAKDVLLDYEGMADNLANMTGKAVGSIKLVVNHYVAAAYLPAILQAFCQQYPEIMISVRTTDGNVDIISESIDVMVHSGRSISEEVVGVRIDESRRVLCATPDYIKRFGMPRTPADLERHRLVVHSTNEGHSWGFQRGKRLLVSSIRPYVSIDNHLLLRDLVQRGIGIGRLGRVLIEEDLKAGRLTQLLSGYTPVYAPSGDLPSIWVLYPSRHLPMRTRIFVDFLIQALRLRKAE